MYGIHIFSLQYLHANLNWEITGIAGIHAIPITFMCILQGTFCDTGIPCTFYGGNVCSAASRHSVVDASSNSKFLSLVSSGYNTSKSPGLIHRVKIFFSVFKKMQFHHFQVINSIRHETCSIRHKKGIGLFSICSGIVSWFLVFFFQCICSSFLDINLHICIYT